MRKTTIAAALALVCIVTYDASAMTLASLRPNLMHMAATAQTEPTAHASAFGWLITIAATTIETVKERLVQLAPAGQSAARESYKI